jgi:hypothetical protein
MAGYRRQPKTYVLKFEDYEGLEVVCRSVSVKELLIVLELADAMTTAPDKKQMEELFGWFVKRLIGWNLEDEDGKPVPATLQGLLAQDFEFALAMVNAWVGAISPGKSATSSNGTAPTGPDPLEASIPMTTPA